MSIYYILYILMLLITALMSLVRNKFERQIILTTVVVVLILFAGLRNVGSDADSLNYLYWFEQIQDSNELNLTLLKDPAFYVLVNAAIGLNFGLTAVFMCYAAISLWSKFSFIKQTDSIEYAPIFLYLYFCRAYIAYDMTAIRAGAAMGLASLALILFFRKSIFQSIFIYIAAITFHLSAFVVFPFFLLLYFKYSFKSRITIIIASVFALITNYIFEGLVSLFNLVQVTRIEDYLHESTALNLFSAYFFIRTVFLLYIICFQWSCLSYFQRFIIYICAASLFIQVALAKNQTLALRASEMFIIFDITLFLIPYFLPITNHRQTQFVYSFFLVLFGGFLYISSMNIINL